MLNNVVIVGRIKEKTIENINENKKIMKIKIKVPREFKNEEGTYDNDIITTEIWNMGYQTIEESLKEGIPIGIKGRIQTDENENMKIIADKVTILMQTGGEK